MRLTPTLIPHTQFHLGSWYIAVENPLWYYFLRKKNNNIISDSNFIESVDAPLKELVQFLHHKGIATTPSCSGHYRDVKEYEKVYTTLEEEKKLILAEGLLLKDIETGKICLYKNKEYRLPWSRQDFLDKVIRYQHHGVLGIRLGNRRKIREQIMQLKIEGVHFIQRDSILLILMFQKDKASNLSSWEKITKNVQEIFMMQGLLLAAQKN